MAPDEQPAIYATGRRPNKNRRPNRDCAFAPSFIAFDAERFHVRTAPSGESSVCEFKTIDSMKQIKTACFVFALLPFANPASADDLFIWSPVKVSNRSYKTTVGFRLPMEWETSAGADLALASNKSGAPMPGSGQAMLWGRLEKVSVTPASRAQQDVTLQVDTLRGSGALMLSRSRSWILSDTLDMQTTRSVSVGYDAVDARQATVSASQAINLIHPWTGTSISAGSSVGNVNGDFSSTLGVSQTLFPNLGLNASVTDPLSTGRTGNINVNYQLNW